MGTGNDKKYLQAWGFNNRFVFEKSIQHIIADLEFDAPRIFDLFQKKVEEWEKDFLKQERKRFFAETIEPPQNNLIKSPQRIVQKIIDSWNAHDKWKAKGGRGEAPLKHDPKKFLTTMTDVIRFRIVCNYLSDVAYVDQKLSRFVKDSGDLEIKSKDNHIETPFPKRRAGHRAVQYVLKYCQTEQPILFEIQIMTQLQHAWDKKDHHLIYEYVRIKEDENIPVHLKNRMAALSEMLYVADTVFDTLREYITEIMENPKK